jgi:hypothetical protein
VAAGKWRIWMWSSRTTSCVDESSHPTFACTSPTPVAPYYIVYGLKMSPDCPRRSQYIHIYPYVVVACPHLQPVALYYIMFGLYRPVDSSAPSYTPLLTLYPTYIHIICGGLPYLTNRCSVLHHIVVIDARLPPPTPRRSQYILRMSIYAVACPLLQPVVCIISFTDCRR